MAYSQRVKRIGWAVVCVALYGSAAVVMPDGDTVRKLVAIGCAAIAGIIQWKNYDA
jgi:hypothetical protein